MPTARNFTATQPFGASTNVGSLYYLMSMPMVRSGIKALPHVTISSTISFSQMPICCEVVFVASAVAL